MAADGTTPDIILPKGRFVTLEGGEGAGKSTQARRLAERLRAAGIGVVATREPGGSPGAEAMRQVLLSGKVEALGPDAEAMMFAAARADHIDHTIRPALDRGDWVICDRFTDSTRVYQKAADPKLLDALETVALAGCRPHLTLLLDLPAEIGLERAAERRGSGEIDRFEKDALDLHRDRRDAFLGLARSQPDRIAVIDATKDPDTVADDVWYAVKTRLGEAVTA